MEIDAVSMEGFFTTALVEENSEFKEDRECLLHPTFWTEKGAYGSLRSRHIKPLMSRPPDKVEGTVRGGYDEERGGYVEGSISFQWGNTDESDESSNEKGDPDNSGHDVSSTDRD